MASNTKRIPSFVGVHITPERLDAVHCDTSIVPWQFERHSVEIPTGIISTDGDILNEKLLIETIQAFWKMSGFVERKVVLALWGKKVIARLVQLPQLPPEHLYQTILSEAERYALFREESELLLDFEIQRNGDDLWIVYAVAPKNLVYTYKKIFQKSRLHLVAIDLAQMASQRGIAYYYSPEDEEGWSSAIKLPGKMVITHWREKQLVTWREVALLFYGDEEDFEDFESMANNFASEVVRTIGVESSISSSYPLYIVADTRAASSELAQFITKRHYLDMEVIGGFSDPDEPESTRDMSLISLGASLWNHWEELIPTTNLLAYEKPSVSEIAWAIVYQIIEKQKPQIPTYLTGIGIAAAAGSVIWWGGGYFEKQLGQESQNRRQEIAVIQNDISQIEQVLQRESQSEFSQLQRFIQEETARKNDFSETFITQVHTVVPADTWINSLKLANNNQLEIEGGSMDKNSGVYFAEILMKNFPQIKTITTLENRREKLHYIFKIGVKY